MYSCECVAFRDLMGSWTMGLEFRRGAGTEVQEGVRFPSGDEG